MVMNYASNSTFDAPRLQFHAIVGGEIVEIISRIFNVGWVVKVETQKAIRREPNINP